MFVVGLVVLLRLLVGGEGVFVDDVDVVIDGKIGDVVFGFEFGDEGCDFGDGFDEGIYVGELGVDVYLYVFDGNVGEFGGGFVGGGGEFEWDVEFVVVFVGGDFGVCVGIDVGVDVDCDGGFYIEFISDVIDVGEFGFVFDVEGENFVFEGEFDFGFGFVDVGEDIFFYVGFGGENVVDFVFVDEIE